MSYITKALSWLKQTCTAQKPVFITLGIYLFFILVKNLSIKFMDGFEWYKTPVIAFLQYLEWMALILLALSLIAKIPYVRVPLITLGMSAFLLMGVETTCLVLYEYDKRPGKEEEPKQAEENTDKPGVFQKFLALFKKEEKWVDTPAPVIPPVKLTAAELGVDTLPSGFEEMKIPGEPRFRMNEIGDGTWQQPDTAMGYVNKPNGHLEIQSYSYGIPNPYANYNNDSLGRRVTGNPYSPSRKKYALFYGCSIAYGVLVDDKQSLPSIFERVDTNYKAYNYAVSGYGTHHLLALFQNRDMRKEVPEKDGVAFYIYFYGHINRALGDMESYLSWNSEGPFYYLDGDDNVIRRGNFNTGRKLVSWFYRLLPKTYIGKYFNIRLPGKLRQHHFHYAARLIEESYKEYRKQFGNDQFYVVLMPGWGTEIQPELDKLNIKYLNYDRAVSYWQDTYQFTGDGHPRPMLYKVLAEHLDNDVIKKQDSLPVK